MRMPVSSAPITSAPASPVVPTSSTGASAAAASAYQPASETLADRGADELGEQLTGAGEWQVLAGEQVGGQGPHSRAVLGRAGVTAHSRSGGAPGRARP